MTHKAFALVIAATLGGLAPLATPVIAHADDQTYLDALSDQQFYNRIGPQKLLAVGHAVCDELASGTDETDIIDEVRNTLNLSSYAAGFVVGVAMSGLGC